VQAFGGYNNNWLSTLAEFGSKNALNVRPYPSIKFCGDAVRGNLPGYYNTPVRDEMDKAFTSIVMTSLQLTVNLECPHNGDEIVNSRQRLWVIHVRGIPELNDRISIQKLIQLLTSMRLRYN
jgi:hypothetical protein